MKTTEVQRDCSAANDESALLRLLIEGDCEGVDRDLRAIIWALRGVVDALEHGDDVDSTDVESVLDLASALNMKTRSLRKRTSGMMLVPFEMPAVARGRGASKQ